MVERGPEKAGVGGSIPSLATTFSINYKSVSLRFHSNANTVILFGVKAGTKLKDGSSEDTVGLKFTDCPGSTCHVLLTVAVLFMITIESPWPSCPAGWQWRVSDPGKYSRYESLCLDVADRDRVFDTLPDRWPCGDYDAQESESPLEGAGVTFQGVLSFVLLVALAVTTPIITLSIMRSCSRIRRAIYKSTLIAKPDAVATTF